MNSLRQNVIKHKVGLLNLAAEFGNVHCTCRVMGFTRDIFYRCQAAIVDGAVEAILDVNRKKPNFRNRIEESIEIAFAAFAVEQRAFGQVRVSNELRKRGVFVYRPLACDLSGCDAILNFFLKSAYSGHRDY